MAILIEPPQNELSALQNLSDTAGFLKKTGDGSYSIDNNNYLPLSGGNVTGVTNFSLDLSVRGRQFVGGGASTYVPTAGSSLIAREAGDTFIGAHNSGSGAMVIGWDTSEDRGTIAVDSSQDIVFITDMSTVDNADNLSGKTPKLVIKGGGNVGIGTTTPATKLHVNGGQEVAIFSSPTAHHYITVGTASNIGGYIQYNNVNQALVLGHHGVARMLVLSANGNVGIDTLSPSQKLDINGSAKATSFIVENNQVVSSRKSGWVAPTGTPTRTTFATSTVTLPQLAERVKALIDDLRSHGLIGA
ncbi:hypothetical protein L2E81_21100 [Planktothrix agardhii 1033]|nr:hypothetical protein [Planktothrix agardhii 1033]